jgi:two-component system heavy metal sensor histidine kinase CusS
MSWTPSRPTLESADAQRGEAERSSRINPRGTAAPAPRGARGRLSRALARIDVQLSLAVGASTALLLSAVLVALLAFAVLEAFEEKQAELERATVVVAALIAVHGPLEAAPPGIAFRVRAAEGQLRDTRGPWPEPSDARAVDVTLWNALASSGRDFMQRQVPLPDGATLELAMPLRHFVRERGELLRSAAWILLASLLATLGLGVAAARWALAPLREATAGVRRIDPRHLDARIPVRGTGDDVDALADAINQVLTRLDWAFRRLSGFSADVAHELRTPVNRLLHLSEVSLLDERDVAGRADALVAVRDTAEEMRRLIEQLLLLARGEEGGLPLNLEAADLGALAAGLVELYAPVADASGQALELAVDPAASLHLRADTALLQHALGNLLDNALRHTPRGGTIRVTLLGDALSLRVTVDDSGPGIPPAQRESVFERFVRLDVARSGGGTGLGLAIARMIARLHGGEIAVEDSPLGGASLQMRLERNPGPSEP